MGCSIKNIFTNRTCVPLTNLHSAVAGVELAALAKGEAVPLVAAQEVLLGQPRDLRYRIVKI